MRQRRITLCCCLLLSVTAKADLVGGIRFSGTTEINDSGWRNSLGVSPYINYLYSAQNFNINSSASANLSTSDGFELSPLDWRASVESVVNLPLPTLSAVAGYRHSVSDTLFEDRQRITDSYNAGLVSNFSTGSTVQHTLAANIGVSHARVETNGDESSSESTIGSVSYTGVKRHSSGSSNSLNVTGVDYFNDTTSLGFTGTYIRPRPSGTLTLALGATNTTRGEADSLALTGQASYSSVLPRGINSTVSISKSRTDTNSLIATEEVEIDIPSQNVVDVTTASARLSAQALSGRMTNSLSYSLSYIETVFIVDELSLFGGSDRYSDIGRLTSSYQLSEYSTISASSRFSLRERTATLLGNIEYRRELAQNLSFTAGISSSDFSEGISRYYATLTYNLQLIQTND